MKRFRRLALAAALFAAAPLAAQDAAAPVPAPAAPVAAPAPKLLVVISVDQFSADLFAEYRRHFTGGFARLLAGAVFPAGYQGHAATETCPGHSTILTGSRPSRTGIIANDWIDLKAARADKTVYCAEDERVPGSSSSSYTVSDLHLAVPTLGEWMKAANPAARVVSVAGKDRAAVMLGGHQVDELWWWDGAGAFATHAGRTTPPVVARINRLVADRLAQPAEPFTLPAYCRTKDQAIAIGAGRTVGTGRFARSAGDARAFRASPEFDEAVLTLAGGLAVEMKLGQGAGTDLLAIGASATDYVGHGYGTDGTEMCLQMFALDQYLGKLFAVLDRTGVDYAVALTADHGGHDLPERNRLHAAPDAERIAADFSIKAIGEGIARDLGLSGQLLWGGPAGDVWIDQTLTTAQRAAVAAEAAKRLAAHRQVAAVFTAAQIAATPSPRGAPDSWTLIERARASYYPGRSGDLVIALKPRVTPIADPTRGSVATHGSFWDYDRRVPILFWRKGTAGFEQPLAVETADIAPTLAALIGLAVPVEIDGRCLDLDAGPGNICD